MGSAGFAFVAVLMVMLVLAILIAGVLAMAVSARNLSASRHEYAQALYVAEAGVNKLVSDWRTAGAGNPPAQPYEGDILNQGRKGHYYLTWDYWHPHGDNSLIRYDVVVLTSRGTVNTGLPGSTIYNLTRTIQVNLDTNGDWAWSHVYTTNDPNAQYQVPPYADINGASGVIAPLDYLSEHGPGMSSKLPTPKWNEWEAAAFAYDTLPYSKVSNGIADPNRHVYWSGQTTSSHTGAGHTHYNYFTPDPYFPSLSYPAAYGCNNFTVEFRKQAGTDYNGVYYIHGNVIIKNGVTITGTIVATGNITFQGQAITIIPLVTNGQNCATRTVYPAIIGGYDVEVRDQSTFHTTGIVWAGHSFIAKAADQAGCIVSPHVTLSGNFSVTYGFDTSNPSCPRYEPGSSPPPMFNEPGMDAMQPTPHSYREM
jgi:type II secretory pathway pseudopilin PulG